MQIFIFKWNYIKIWCINRHNALKTAFILLFWKCSFLHETIALQNSSTKGMKCEKLTIQKKQTRFYVQWSRRQFDISRNRK